MGELLLTQEQLVGVGFSRQALAVGVLRIAGALLGAVNVPEVEVHVVRDNRGDNAVLQVHEGTHRTGTHQQQNHGDGRQAVAAPVHRLSGEETHQVGNGCHDNRHAHEHHGEKRPNVQQAAQNQAVVAYRVANGDGRGLHGGVRTLHEQAEHAVAVDADFTQLRFEGGTFEEDPVILQDDALVGGEALRVG